MTLCGTPSHLRYIRQFFPLDAVLEGLFDLLGDLFDVQVGDGEDHVVWLLRIYIYI